MAAQYQDSINLFLSGGGKLLIESAEFKSRSEQLKAIILDWDGVFNNGVKDGSAGSPFSEVDSMGLNMLRFGYYLKYGFVLPVFIITGENNQPALRLSEREHYNGVYLKMTNKLQALAHLQDQFKIMPNASGFVFDDILDLGVANNIQLRYYVKREGNPLLNEYVLLNKLADYTTAANGSNFAVREICELTLGALEVYNQVVENRVLFSEKYQAYLSLRNSIGTEHYIGKNDRITKYEKS